MPSVASELCRLLAEEFSIGLSHACAASRIQRTCQHDFTRWLLWHNSSICQGEPQQASRLLRRRADMGRKRDGRGGSRGSRSLRGDFSAGASTRQRRARTNFGRTDFQVCHDCIKLQLWLKACSQAMQGALVFRNWRKAVGLKQKKAADRMPQSCLNAAVSQSINPTSSCSKRLLICCEVQDCDAGGVRYTFAHRRASHSL